MKESIGGTTLFIIVIFFIVLFTGYLCFSINQSRAFSVKNGIVRIVERYGNMVGNADDLQNIPGFRTDITNELTNVGYRTVGICNTDNENDAGWVAFKTDGTTTNDGDGVFCIKYVGDNPDPGHNVDSPVQKLHYFKIKTFYHFDLPVFRNMLRMNVEGNTKSMQFRR